MINIDPKEVYTRLETVGHRWASANAKAELLEESAKSELSSIAIGFLDKGSSKSMSEAETRARASAEYREHIRNMVSARKEANDAKVSYNAAQAWFEGLRTQAATLRSEMRNLGSTT